MKPKNRRPPPPHHRIHQTHEYLSRAFGHSQKQNFLFASILLAFCKSVRDCLAEPNNRPERKCKAYEHEKRNELEPHGKRGFGIRHRKFTHEVRRFCGARALAWPRYFPWLSRSICGEPGFPSAANFPGTLNSFNRIFCGVFRMERIPHLHPQRRLRFATAIQAWRWGGLGFISLYANHVLPWLFAFPAGLGDMVVGVTAPWMLLQLVRNPSFAASRRYKLWNISGLVDFAVAVTTATLCSGLFPGITRVVGNITTSPMTHLPLVLIPAYMVPFFSMVHFTALFQARQLARQKITTMPLQPPR